MKKFLSSVDFGLLIGRMLVALFTFGFIIAVFDQNYSMAADYIVMIILAVTLNLKTQTIRNYERLTDSYQTLVDAHDGIKELSDRVIKKLTHALQERDEQIAILKEQLNAQPVTPKKNVRKARPTPDTK